MSPDYSDDRLGEWQSTIDDIHGDVDLEDPMLDIEVEESKPGGDMEVTEITVVRPILVGEGEEPIEVTRRLDRADGGQIAVTVRKQFRCPSCHYFPQYELDRYEEPPELKGWCVDCNTLTCSECKVTASCCEANMCFRCSEAFITEDGPLCSRHRQDAVEERNFQREMDIWEQRRKDKELHLRYELQYIRLELEARIKEQEQRLRAYVEQWKHIDRMTKNQIEKKRIELTHMVDRRKQALKEFETAAEVELRREKQALDGERLELDREKHRDRFQLDQRAQDLKYQQQGFNEYIEEERLKIERAERLARAREADARAKLQNMKSASGQLQQMNSTPEITV